MRNSAWQKRSDLLLIFKRVLNQLNKSYLVHIPKNWNVHQNVWSCKNAIVQQRANATRLKAGKYKNETWFSKLQNRYLHWSNLAQNGEKCTTAEWMLLRFSLFCFTSKCSWFQHIFYFGGLSIAEPIDYSIGYHPTTFILYCNVTSSCFILAGLS